MLVLHYESCGISTFLFYQNFFIDKTTEYGLDGITATNFNLVDLDRDDFTDLVILKSLN